VSDVLLLVFVTGMVTLALGVDLAVVILFLKHRGRS
jgi:hypothetical protein